MTVLLQTTPHFEKKKYRLGSSSLRYGDGGRALPWFSFSSPSIHSKSPRYINLSRSSMSNDIFDGQILAEKLSKLNNSQQSIESLSRWCIPHQKRAKDIVEIWDKLFNASQKEQRVSFLNLANDILQNSRRKGSEFVNEFWKVLPAALRCVYESGDVHGRKAVNRLIDVWEERKVFGSRSQGLKDELMSSNPLPCPVSNGKGSDSIKIMKRDAHSVRIKLDVGCLPEKILTAFHSVLDEHLNEEAALNKCNAGVHDMVKLLEDVENTLAQGSQPGSTLANELQEREKELKQYMEQLENAEAARDSLLSQLKDALHEQELKQELVRSQLLVCCILNGGNGYDGIGA